MLDFPGNIQAAITVNQLCCHKPDCDTINTDAINLLPDQRFRQGLPAVTTTAFSRKCNKAGNRGVSSMDS